MDKNILLIGGAGYIGIVVAQHFLKRGCKVKIYDSFLYNHEKCSLSISNEQNIDIIHGDLRDSQKLKEATKNIDSVVLLAGLVGDPITKKYPKLSEEIHLHGIKESLNILSGCDIKRLIFVSTCSNYGLLDENQLANENTNLNPLSIYAKHKVEIENYIVNLKGKVSFTPTILRFATAFGLSPRMRFDLSVNEFVYELLNQRELVIYDKDTWRPYCHVKDFAYLIQLVLEAPLKSIDFQIFNAGCDENNATKQQIVDLIKEYLPQSNIEYKDMGFDARNYKVNFKKVRDVLGFKPKFLIKDGIEEIIQAYKDKKFEEVDSNRNFYGNYEIKK